MLEWLFGEGGIAVELLTALVALVALGFSLFNFFESRHRKRRKLVDAIYHHTNDAVNSLEGARHANNEARKEIRKNRFYTPYVPRSDADDLTYDQIIELMELLNEQESSTLLSYFHHEAELHAYAQSFDLELVRGWRSARKLSLWKRYEASMEDTLKYAVATRDVLKRLR